MSHKKEHWSTLQQGNLRSRKWKRFIKGPDQILLEELYVPALGEAVRYDRCCSYFSSSVLSTAARGFGKLIERLEKMGENAPRPAVRLVVNEELSREDVRALNETGDLSKLEKQLKKRFKKPKDALEKERLAMLGWLVKKNYLHVRVGVMRHGEGIVHAKFGIMTDEKGDSVVFSGSGNESAQGIIANYERLEVSTSWGDPVRYQEYSKEFEDLWNDTHPDVHTVTLPEAIELDLIKYAPEEPPIAEPSKAVARQKAAMVWQFLVESPYLPNGEAVCDATALVDPWPHQRKVVEETANAWPEGRLLCDEVGMGKTIEAILILRRLLAGRGVKRVLILLPAGLLKQWQAELREKGGLIFPRLEGTNHLFWPDKSNRRVNGLEEALQQDMLLMSRETARLEDNLAILLNAKPWDLVILDEAHAARRKKQEEGEYNSGTLLLNLLRQLQLRRKSRSVFLLSATPMQTHPWEPWDLLAVLGEGGRWLADFSGIRDYYNAISTIRKGTFGLETARNIAAMITADSDFPESPDNIVDIKNQSELTNNLWFTASSEHQKITQWLRQGSPLTRRMHRNTRNTLRKYHQLGILDYPLPSRRVTDIIFDYKTQAERDVYNSIKTYVETRFEELEKEKPGKGFVMTIYRRRASSSPLAFERSLERRKEGLLYIAHQQAYDTALSSQDVPEALDVEDLPEGEKNDKVSSAFPQDPKVARAELEEVERLLEEVYSLQGQDTKRDCFSAILRKIREDGRTALVFTEYVDTMEYLRDLLFTHYGIGVGCYSGSGGEIWDGDKWKLVTKDRITEMLHQKKIHVLICTDAASEGLNLQAAGAIVNYDLPWNPSRVEQRIGRIDRIGQLQKTVHIVNLFLKDSVDERVYKALRKRCGLFEHFVGPMQPVLASARRMLLGREKEDIQVLENIAKNVEQEPIITESYIENEAESLGQFKPPVSRSDLVKALEFLSEDFGLKVQRGHGRCKIRISDRKKFKLGFTVDSLENDPGLLPFTLLTPEFQRISDELSHSGERLPLVIGAYQSDSFRRSIALWVGQMKAIKLKGIDDLVRRVKEWNGDYPEPLRWVKARKRAEKEAKKQVKAMMSRAEGIFKKGLNLQIKAAQLRLQKELGRYLVCIDDNTSTLNKTLRNQMVRDIASAKRLRKCIEKLGGYPQWDPELMDELKIFIQQLPENKRKARLLGSEIDAALEDPRWIAAEMS